MKREDSDWIFVHDDRDETRRHDRLGSAGNAPSHAPRPQQANESTANNTVAQSKDMRYTASSPRHLKGDIIAKESIAKRRAEEKQVSSPGRRMAGRSEDRPSRREAGIAPLKPRPEDRVTRMSRPEFFGLLAALAGFGIVAMSIVYLAPYMQRVQDLSGSAPDAVMNGVETGMDNAGDVVEDSCPKTSEDEHVVIDDSLRATESHPPPSTTVHVSSKHEKVVEAPRVTRRETVKRGKNDSPRLGQGDEGCIHPGPVHDQQRTFHDEEVEEVIRVTKRETVKPGKNDSPRRRQSEIDECIRYHRQLQRGLQFMLSSQLRSIEFGAVDWLLTQADDVYLSSKDARELLKMCASVR